MFKTITVDNGSEFADWEGMQQSAADESEKRVTVFYCHPYCSFERGSNENQNRLVRRKIPKGENFDDRTEDDIQMVEDWINDYPREMFGWKPPANCSRKNWRDWHKKSRISREQNEKRGSLCKFTNKTQAELCKMMK